MRRRRLLQFLKLIGIGMFSWILWNIDRTSLLNVLRDANEIGVIAAFLILVLGMYTAKALRWHFLVRSTGLTPTFRDSWKLFHIGIFLGSITPANLGEFGRVAYLRKQGLHGGTGTAIVLLDRLADVVMMGSIGVAGIGLLFGTTAFAAAVGVAALGIIAFFALWKTSRKLRTNIPWLDFLSTLSRPPLLATYVLTTVLAWTIYFAWTIVLARAVGIEADISVMVSALTLTGIISLLPISPSGLGTRDATLLFLFAPFGIPASQTVALSSLMFVLILGSGLPGLFYWLQPHRDH